MLKFERRHEPLAPRQVFYRRLLRTGATAGAVVLVSLLIGTVGYRATAGLGWLDAWLNASMILTGMGPVNPMPNDAAKLFASLYAIFSGVVFISAVGLLLAPAVHRFFHHFHLELDEEGNDRPLRAPPIGLPRTASRRQAPPRVSRRNRRANRGAETSERRPFRRP